jgi:hypothetical protein
MIATAARADTTLPILAQARMTPQQNSHSGRLRWFGTILFVAAGCVLVSIAAWLLWDHVTEWSARGRWESYTVGQWLETRAMRELLPDAVRKVFVGSSDHPAPLQDAADAVSVWSLCLVTGMTILWRAVRWKD